MKHTRVLSSLARRVGPLLAALALASAAAAQYPARALVTQPIDDSRTITLHGTVHPLAQPRFDQGAVPDSFAANRMLLMLNRPAERESALQQFLADAHTQGTAAYHKWLTPEQFGQLYGPADSDIQTASQWLASHGFRVARVAKGKTLVEFSGTAANVREAFHAEIHQYNVRGETHYANATELAIPEALAPLVHGVSAINNFYAQPTLQTLGATTYSRSSNPAKPAFTNPDGMTELFAIAPEDFATQYDLAPLYSAGTNGSGQTIGILNRSNIDVSLANAYRTLFNLSANPPQVVIDGDDPGIIADRIEAYLDVELSGAVAPEATVNLYIADGSGVQDPLVLAALRAIEDDQASVLSASYEECELELDGNNGLWSGLWEQASAQGQTAFVASGDSGPALCAELLTLPQDTNVSPGLTVNGLASTPWDVAVGGTDFYYSDYASGAPSAPTFWNQTNDSNFGSLKAPLPEQPWDNALGLNAIPFVSGTFASFSVPTPAGGGGPSNCSQVALTPSVMCTGGYQKPAWQNAPGVPVDGARDIPDLSLFAAAGQNFSWYAICAQEGDCSTANGAQPTVLLVGGTSASSPAMAGIMALINQKYGRQGQADFTLYALANQQPSVFHDVTVGTNDVLCFTEQSPACDTPVTLGIFNFMDFGVYPAGPGYDLASGLGSVDANALVNDWTKISFLPTSTSLSLSPTSIVHGTPVTFTANVSPTSGSGTPGGDVDISISSTQPLPHSGAVPVVNGTASESVDFFPGGTYQVTARYAGDGTFAPSTSTPMSLSVTPEDSTVSPIVAYSYIDYTTNTAHGGYATSGQQIPFGAAWTFEAVPSSTTNGTSGTATGTVTFTDGTTTIPSVIGSAGIASVSIPSLAVGAHSVSVSYSGDASFNASSGGPLTFTVVQGIPKILLTPSPQEQIFTIGGSASLLTGTNLTIGVLVGTAHGVAPSGNISVTLGSATQTVPLAPFLDGGEVLANAQVTFNNLQPGTYTLSANYPGDANWNSATSTYPIPINVASATVTPTTTALAISPSSVDSEGNVTFTATVQAGAGATGPPAGIVQFLVDGVNVALTALSGSGGTSATAKVVVASTSLPNGTDQVVASYSGLVGFGPSTSAPVSVTVNPTDFRLFLGEDQFAVPSGKSGTATLNLAPVNGSSVTVTLACVTSSSSFTCGASPSNPMVSGATTATLIVNAYTLGSSNAQNVPLAGKRSPNPPAGLFGTIALMLLVVIVFAARSPRHRSWALACLAFVLLVLANACGGGNNSTGPPPPQQISTPAGNYSVLVTATANGTIHNVKLNVVVQ